MRKRFVYDADGNLYLIDAHLQQEFEMWNAATPFRSKDFESDMIAGSIEAYTFTDPQED